MLAWVQVSPTPCTSPSAVRTIATRRPVDLGQGGAHGRQLVEPADPHEAGVGQLLAHAAPPASSRLELGARWRHQALLRARARRSGRRCSAKKPRTTRRLGLVLGDAARLQVEQLLVVEPACGGGVPGALDLAGLDLEVRHRVGAGAVGEHEVAVELVGVGALGLGADQHVADPHGVGGRRPGARPCRSTRLWQCGASWSTNERCSRCWPASAK